ncbi:hypothetical protein [Actinacidiphila rubida]|uniref:Uncharacterized protein n=1 Tax=Actinacidiphila rubida TaxID=310780 RepID=A0A1H8E5T1_9ACTN|nr:hypothetical protein [Actinacidiphila rubida]SEN14770.1 hypothetical protein SAMN05216267_100226 [Actinacidiphila rubida]
MPGTAGTNLVIGLTNTPQDVNGLQVASDRLMKITPPATIGTEHIDYAVKDLEAILASMKQHPREHVELQNALLRQDLPKALAIADKVGVSEAALTQQGGAQWGVVIVIAIAAALLLSSDSGSKSSSPPKSSGSGSDAGTPQ